MNITRSKFLLSIAGILVDSKSLLRAAAQGNAGERDVNLGVTAVRPIEENARPLNIDDDASLTKLTASVLDHRHALNLSGAPKLLICGRLASAEKSYWHDSHPGVHEPDLGFFINDLVSRLRLPAFAAVNDQQIRLLRVRSLYTAPVFMGRGMTTAYSKPGDYINPRMSPLQAMHLLPITADQKLLNPDFQYEPEEWTRQYERQRLMRIRKALVRPDKPFEGFFSADVKGYALHDALNAGLESLSIEEQVSLATTYMNRFAL